MPLNAFEQELARANQILADQLARERQPGEIAIASTAEQVVRRLQTVFEAFMQTLDPDEEIGLALTSFGAVRQISVETVTALGPNLLQIDGYEDGQRVTLIQHLSQLSFLLIPLRIASPEQQPRRKIGFQVE